MITTKNPNKTNNETNKQTKKNRNGLCNNQTCLFVVLIQGNEKTLMRFAAVSAKTLNV